MGTSVYPGSLDNFATTSPAQLVNVDSTGRDHDARHDDLEAAVENIEAELGTNPSSSWSTVTARLAVISQVTHPFTDDVRVQVYDAGKSAWQTSWYDSGKRNVASLLVNGWTGTAVLQRAGMTVRLVLSISHPTTPVATYFNVGTLPAGFAVTAYGTAVYRNSVTGVYTFGRFGMVESALPAANQALTTELLWIPDSTAVPASLPGTLSSAASV